MMPYMSLCVVMIDLGNLRDQIFPRTGFAPRAPARGAAAGPLTGFSLSLSPQNVLLFHSNWQTAGCGSDGISSLESFI